MCCGGIAGINMCTGGKDRELHVHWREKRMADVCWRESLGKLRGVPLQRTQKQEIGQAFPSAHIFLMQLPPAHTYSGSFSFGLREWTITNFPGLSSQLNSRDNRLF